MYSGFSKDNGGVIGVIGRGENNYLDGEEAIETLAAEESFICESADGQLVSMVAALSPETGALTWQPEPQPAWVSNRTVSMSQMTSMLHDTDRNGAYEVAISKSIAHFKRLHGRKPVVLDIGTGTGLLAMFSMRHGASHVVGCEMFETMANIAQEVVESNGLAADISIQPIKSTDLDVSPFADLIVSEILDSSLLGESCLFSHRDAVDRLLNDSVLGCEGGNTEAIGDRIIPYSAKIFATLIDSDVVAHLREVNSFGLEWNPFRSEEARDCRGGCNLIPMHWSSLQARGGRWLSEPTLLMEVDLTGKSIAQSSAGGDEDDLTYDEIDVPVVEAGHVSAVLLWWEVQLLSPNVDPLGEVKYSTKPGEQKWQDHWVQVVALIPKRLDCKIGDIVKVRSAHNGISIWLGAEKVIVEPAMKKQKDKTRSSAVRVMDQSVALHEDCSCGWHLLYGGDRIQMCNDQHRNSVWDRAMDHIVAYVSDFRSTELPDSVAPIALDVGDGSMLALTLGCKMRATDANPMLVVSQDAKLFSRIFFDQLVNANGLENGILIFDGIDWQSVADFVNDDVNGDASECEHEAGADIDIPPQQSLYPRIAVLMSECFQYQLSSLPTWRAISFHYQRTCLHELLLPNAIVCPRLARIMAAPVQLADLCVSHGLVGTVNGFDHSALDLRMSEWHQHMFPYKLGNYRKTILAAPQCIGTLDYRHPVANIGQTVVVTPMTKIGTCHCVAIWVDYQLDDSGTIALEHFLDSDFPPYYTLNLKYFDKPIDVTLQSSISFRSSFTKGDSDFAFEFNIA